MPIKQEPITTQKLGSCDFRRNGESAIPPPFNGPEMLSSAFDKAKLFTEIFSKNSTLDDSSISLPAFASTQWAFICSKLTIETLEQGVKYVQS